MANVTIGSNVFIGAYSIVLPGITIGDNVIVGAGSVVVHDIPSGSVAVGAPARVVKTLSQFIEEKKSEMQEENTFGEEYTIRNPYFCDAQKGRLIETCKKKGKIYVY